MCPFAQEPIDQKATKLETLRHQQPLVWTVASEKAYPVKNILTEDIHMMNMTRNVGLLPQLIPFVMAFLLVSLKSSQGLEYELLMPPVSK
jgi:hypothetical protein